MHTELHHVEGDGPDLVYVPGLDGSGEMLLETAEHLRKRYRLIQVRYETDEKTPTATLDDLSLSLAAVLERMDVRHPLLLTESFGGPVTMNCAVHSPGIFRSIAIVNSFGRYPKRFGIQATRFGAAVLPKALFYFFRPMVAHRFFGELSEDDAVERFLHRERLNFDEGYKRRLALIASLDLRPRLSSLETPVHLFASEKDLIVPAVRCAKELERLLPNATLRTIPRGGHVVLPLQSLPWVDWLAEAFGEPA